MKKIVLIGDSIRMGYDKYVKEALEGTAEVYDAADNSRFAEYLLRYAHEWKNEGNWGDDVDLVHWNAGLWDALELFGDEPLTPISYYGELIARVDRRLRMLFPRAKMVFATSTNVNAAMGMPEFMRHNATIEKYNAAAIAALAGTDTTVNDLYRFTAALPDAYRSDWVHFYTAAGTEAIGGRVLSVISDLLDISPAEINIANFTPERYSEKNIGY